MPNQTFFNLPDEKRERIIDAAMQEFARYSFDQASIARIIDIAGIPRGSFYQYFENLKDLYKYVFNLAAERKIQYFSATVPDFQGDGFDFFHTLRELFVAGFRFARENPQLLAIGNKFLKESDSALREEVFKEQLPKAYNIYAEMIKKGVELGQLDSQVDLVMATTFMNSINTTFSDYYMAILSKDIDPLSEEEKLLTMVDQMLYLLANGLKNKSD